MPKISAGLILYRKHNGDIEVLLVHPGGPFWAKKDLGAWSIPKGEVDNPGDDLLLVAKREFEEEAGFASAGFDKLTARGNFLPLGSITQKGGKIVQAWAFEGDCDPQAIKSNTIFIEWPPRSGKQMEIPEVDRAEFFEINIAKTKINPGQIPFLENLEVEINK